MKSQCERGNPASPRINKYIDVNLYFNRFQARRGKVCTTLCSPDRVVQPRCLDWVSTTVVNARTDGNGSLDCIGDGCSRDALRCADWSDLKEYREMALKGSERANKVLIHKGRGFHPSRYIGYGHFLQDQLRHKEKAITDAHGNIISEPTFYNVDGKWVRSISNSEGSLYPPPPPPLSFEEQFALPQNVSAKVWQGPLLRTYFSTAVPETADSSLEAALHKCEAVPACNAVSKILDNSNSSNLWMGKAGTMPKKGKVRKNYKDEVDMVYDVSFSKRATVKIVQRRSDGVWLPKYLPKPKGR